MTQKSADLCGNDRAQPRSGAVELPSLSPYDKGSEIGEIIGKLGEVFIRLGMSKMGPVGGFRELDKSWSGKNGARLQLVAANGCRCCSISARKISR